MSKWLAWKPSHPQILRNPPGSEPAKPPKPNFAGFEGAFLGENPIVRGTEPTSAPEPREHVKHPGACSYTLPEGVKLVRFTRKAPPVPVTVCSIVTDIDKFVRHALVELDARLHSPVQIKAGDSVFELISKLADCGLELHIEWPPKGQIISDSSDSEPSKPSKRGEELQPGPDDCGIIDEDLPF